MTEAEEHELQQAQEYLAYWQPQLRLDHIDFEIVFMNPEEDRDHLAVSKIAFGKHHQKIEIRHPSQRCERDSVFFRRDLEVVIVHELLHTKETPWRDYPEVDKVFEGNKWIVNLHEDSLDAVAEALVRARRGMKR
jgi:hypothetical protein